MNTFLNMLFNIINIYSYLLMARIILSWIPALQFNPIAQALCSLTDPYLRLFRALPFTSLPGVDFSPIVAIYTLSFLRQLIARFVSAQRIGLDLLMQFVLATINSVVTTVLFILGLIALIRIVSLFITRQSGAILTAFDSLLRPATSFVASIIAKGRIVSYRLLLSVIAVGSFLLIEGVKMAINFLFLLTTYIPF